MLTIATIILIKYKIYFQLLCVCEKGGGGGGEVRRRIRRIEIFESRDGIGMGRREAGKR